MTNSIAHRGPEEGERGGGAFGGSPLIYLERGRKKEELGRFI